MMSLYDAVTIMHVNMYIVSRSCTGHICDFLSCFPYAQYVVTYLSLFLLWLTKHFQSLVCTTPLHSTGKGLLITHPTETRVATHCAEHRVVEGRAWEPLGLKPEWDYAGVEICLDL